MSIEKVSCFPNEGTPEVISGTPVTGDIVRPVGSNGPYYRYTEQAPTLPVPVLLSKTGFMDHAIAKLGGVNRFMQVFEGCRDSTDPTYGPTLRYAYERYQAALTIDKTVAAGLFGVMLAAGMITQNEHDAVINEWPVT